MLVQVFVDIDNYTDVKSNKMRNVRKKTLQFTFLIFNEREKSTTMLRERTKKTGKISGRESSRKDILIVELFFDIFITQEICYHFNTKYQFLSQMTFKLLAEICTKLANSMRYSVFEWKMVLKISFHNKVKLFCSE
jgi:hypothetical protein